MQGLLLEECLTRSVNNQAASFSVYPKSIIEALSRFSGCRVLVIGDIMVDEYLWGTVDRISQEAPVQVVRVEKQEYRLGGCANVVNNICSLGATVSVASVFGGDHHGQSLVDQLKRLKVGTECLLSDKERPTTKKTRVIAVNQQVVRIDIETIKPISKRLERQIVGYLDQSIHLFDLVLLSDYGKGALTHPVITSAVRNSRRNTIPIIVDPKGRNFGKYSGSTAITPNTQEAEIASRIEIKNDLAAERAARRIMAKTGCDAVLIKRGKHGMTLLDASKVGAIHIAARALEVFDVSGAGDTVLSVFGLAAACGLSFEEASHLANIAGGIVVGKLGTSVVNREELLSALNGPKPVVNSKEKKAEELKILVTDLKRQNKRIVFTSGTFDPFHGGHVELLQRTKELGDVLIVAIYSDLALCRLRTDKGLLIGEKERAKMLSGLDYVDYVCILGEGSVGNMIERLQPHVFVRQTGKFKDASEELTGIGLLGTFNGRLVDMEMKGRGD